MPAEAGQQQRGGGPADREPAENLPGLAGPGRPGGSEGQAKGQEQDSGGRSEPEREARLE